MISINAQITKKIENNFRKHKKLNKSGKRNLKEIMKGLILEKTSYLSKIGRKQSPENNDRKNIERYSNALSKADSEEIMLEHLKSKKKWFNSLGVDEEKKEERANFFPQNPNLLLVDGGEVEKKNSSREMYKTGSQKMQHCCGIADGSNSHKPSWGYKLLNISLHTSHNNCTHILSQHLFSSNAPDYVSDWTEQRTKFELIEKTINPQNSIIIEDSIGDDARRINFYRNEMKSHFIVRGQDSRKYEVKFGDELFRMKFSKIGQNMKYDTKNTRKYYDKKAQQEVWSQITYKEVSHPDLKDSDGNCHQLFLVLVKSPAYKVPMAFLTDIRPTNSEEAWRIFFWYKKRWEVEKIYRDIKQKFKLESALIRNYKAWKTLVVLTALAWEIMKEISLKARSFLGFFYVFFEDWLRKKQQKQVTHLNLLDWLREFLPAFKPLFSHRFYSWNIFLHRFQINTSQLSLFPKNKKW